MSLRISVSSWLPKLREFANARGLNQNLAYPFCRATWTWIGSPLSRLKKNTRYPLMSLNTVGMQLRYNGNPGAGETAESRVDFASGA